MRDLSKLGLNFAAAPSKLCLTDTMAAVKDGVRRFSLQDADDLQKWVCGILKHVKVSRNNLTSDQRTVLKELKELQDEVILLADK